MIDTSAFCAPVEPLQSDEACLRLSSRTALARWQAAHQSSRYKSKRTRPHLRCNFKKGARGNEGEK
jgi:hypothetical protein